MNEEILAKMNDLEQGYSTQKKEKEILHLQQQNQKFYIYAGYHRHWLFVIDNLAVLSSIQDTGSYQRTAIGKKSGDS